MTLPIKRLRQNKKRSRTRSLSGILPVALYVKPFSCGGRCIFCPSVIGVPNSYISNEDTLLAKRLGFDPALQFRAWANSLPQHLLRPGLPHEVIILGGSFSALSDSYRRYFVNGLYREMETHRSGDTKLGARCSVLTVESRPDQITESECRFLREIGVSKVEIGVQHTSDVVLETIGRGHTQIDVIRATRLLKNNGFKVGYHVMVGLPGASMEDDCEMLGESLWQPEYHPDYLKVYPCVLLKDRSAQPVLTKLYEEGQWRPPSELHCETALTALARSIPSHVRLSRIQRQFESCKCINAPKPGVRNRIATMLCDLRAKEVGLLSTESITLSLLLCELTRSGNDLFFQVKLNSCGWLLAIARVSICEDTCAVLREIKVFGSAASVGERGQVQGKGLGSGLLNAIEQFLARTGCKTIKTNAAVGARSFFFQYGYVSDHEYFLCKDLQNRSMSSIKTTNGIEFEFVTI